MSKQSAILYLAAVFVAGLLAGGVAGFGMGKHRAFAPPRPAAMAAHICDDLTSKLQLSPEQVAKIEPVVQETVAKIEAVHLASGEQIGKIFQESNQRLAQFLNPSQKLLLEQMERDRQRFIHRTFRPPPGGPRDGGHPPEFDRPPPPFGPPPPGPKP